MSKAQYRRVLCIVWVTLALFVQATTSTTWDDYYESHQNALPQEILRYGLLANGTMDLYLESEYTDVPLYILICNEDQHFMIHEDTSICDALYYTKPCEITQLFYHTTRIYYYFTEFGEYYWYIAHCKPPTVNIKVKLTIFNPGNNNLPSSLIPAPTMYTLMAAVWAIGLFIWLVVAVPLWKNMTGMHYVLLTYPVLKIMFCAYSADYFYTYRITGDLTFGSWTFYRIATIVVLLNFHLVLLLLSKAWSMTGRLEKADFPLIFSMLVGLCISLMVKNLYESATDVVFLLASLAYIGLRVMILACIFININHTISKFESEMLAFNAEADQMDNRQLIVKLHRIFILFKFSLMLWVILNVAEFFCNILFFDGTEQNWVDMTNTEFIDFLLGICIGILLLPKLSLRPLSNPETNEFGEHELTTFHRSAPHHSAETTRHPTDSSDLSSGSPSPSPSPSLSSTPSQDSGEENGGNNRGGAILNGEMEEIELSNGEDDDEVELVDRRKRRPLV